MPELGASLWDKGRQVSNIVQGVMGQGQIHSLICFLSFNTPCNKKEDTKLITITLSNLNGFSKFFHW